jgi:Aspartate ammonia-lyase
MGRTQLQEAVPTTLGNSFHAFSMALTRCQKQLKKSMESLQTLNLGGTAIGTGVNASDGYEEILYGELSKSYQMDLRPAADLLDGTQNLDSFVQVSGNLKALAVSISKMSHDLRLLSSGPKSGFNEIFLPPRQAGSSIMPGKVNPVIPEIASQIAFEVIGNDMTVTIAAESGELELNAFEPVIFHNLFESVDLLGEACDMLATECIAGIKANTKKCKRDVDNSVETITDLTPIIGYEYASEIVKESIKSGINVYEILKSKKLLIIKK